MLSHGLLTKYLKLWRQIMTNDAFIAFWSGMAAGIVVGIVLAAVFAAIANHIEGDRK